MPVTGGRHGRVRGGSPECTAHYCGAARTGPDANADYCGACYRRWSDHGFPAAGPPPPVAPPGFVDGHAGYLARRAHVDELIAMRRPAAEIARRTGLTRRTIARYKAAAIAEQTRGGQVIAPPVRRVPAPPSGRRAVPGAHRQMVAQAHRLQASA